MGDIDTNSPTPASPELIKKQSVLRKYSEDSSEIVGEDKARKKSTNSQAPSKPTEKLSMAPFAKSKTTLLKLAKTIQRRMATKLHLRREQSKLISISTEPKSLRTSRSSLKSDLVLRKDNSSASEKVSSKNHSKPTNDESLKANGFESLKPPAFAPPNSTEISVTFKSSDNLVQSDVIEATEQNKPAIASKPSVESSKTSLARTKSSASSVSNEKDSSPEIIDEKKPKEDNEKVQPNRALLAVTRCRFILVSRMKQLSA